MKKSGLLWKTVLVMALCVVLFVLSAGTPTFSWFTRPNPASGGRLEYGISDSDNVYAYDGGYGDNVVSIVKTQYKGPGANDEYAELTGSANAQTSGTLAAGQRQSYVTTLRNEGAKDQIVSLYINNLQVSSGDCYIGVNSPVKSYTNPLISSTPYANLIHRTAYTESPETVRVYLNPKNVWTKEGWTGIPEAFLNGNTSVGYDLASAGTDSENYNIYYLDIPVSTYKIQFHSKGQNPKWSWTGVVDTEFSSKQSVVYYATGLAIGDGNVELRNTNINGPYFINTYGSATIYTGSNPSMAFVQNTDYLGDNITYSSTSSSVFTVNSSTGVITPVAAGDAKLNVSIKSPTYSDRKEIQIDVKVKAKPAGSTTTTTGNIPDAPIINNLRVKAGEDTEVKWFIMNDAGAGTSMSYSLSNVYIGL